MSDLKGSLLSSSTPPRRASSIHLPPEKPDNFVTPLVGLATLFNILVALGPFTMPYAFYEAGYILGLIITFSAAIVSYIAAEYIIETVGVVNAIMYNEQATHKHELVDVREQFQMRKPVAYIKLAEYTYQEKGRLLATACLCLYMVGSLCIKCVSASQALAKTVSLLFFDSVDGLQIKLGFDPYYIASGVFIIFGTLFSLKNVQNTALLQKVSVVVRFLSIASILGVSIYSINTYGATPFSELPAFNLSKGPQMFGSAIFAFMTHHVLTEVLQPIRPSDKVGPSLVISFGASLILLVGISFLGVIAFGKYDNPCHDTFPCKIDPLYSLNFLPINYIGEIVNLYPVLNIATFPILVISLRVNMMSLLKSKKIPRGKTITTETIIFTLIAVVPVTIISLLAKDKIKLLVDYVGSFAGVAIMLIIPSIIIGKARQLKEVKFPYIENIHESFFKHKGWQILILIISFISMILQFYVKIINPTQGGGGH